LNFDKSRVNKILIIKPAAIGDVLLSTPVIENLRHNFPDAEINFLTQTYCRDVVADNPYLSRVLTYDRDDSGYCIIKNVRKQKYDLVIDLFCNPRTALITFLSRAEYRIGYPFRFRSYAYNIKVKSRSGEVHNIDFNLDALRHLGLEIVSRQPYFEVNDIHTEFAGRCVEENGLASSEIIGINPSGTWETKVWYPEKFVELIRLLNSQYAFLLFWGNEKERAAAEGIKKNAGSNVYMIPEVDLKYAAALIKKCKVFISNDTGPMHIAWVMGVPVCGIYGPTNSKLQGPLGDNSVVIENESLTCLGCNLMHIKDCPYGHVCMRDLRAEEVFKKVKGLLKV
jgi:lipopolysaccharide heptosyltransferase II